MVSHATDLSGVVSGMFSTSSIAGSTCAHAALHVLPCVHILPYHRELSSHAYLEALGYRCTSERKPCCAACAGAT